MQLTVFPTHPAEEPTPRTGAIIQDDIPSQKAGNPRQHPQLEGWESKTTCLVTMLGFQDDIPSQKTGNPRRHPHSEGWESKTTYLVTRLGIQDDIPSDTSRTFHSSLKELLASLDTLKNLHNSIICPKPINAFLGPAL